MWHLRNLNTNILPLYNMKIFITGPSNIDKLSIAKKLVEINDDLSIGSHFTNDIKYRDVTDDEYVYYLSTQDVDLTYKNNFVLFVNTDNYISSGITMDSYYNNDVFTMSMCEFNNISNVIFNSESTDIITVWLDTVYDKNNEHFNEDVIESKFFQERLNVDNIKFLYFYNEDVDTICNTIISYMNGSEDERIAILEENN